MSEEIESHILKRYELLKKQGKGAYGVVYKAMDKKTKKKNKKIKNDRRYRKSCFKKISIIK